ncbi:MAG: hypothetical protein ACFE0J_14645 [Elainellaceae cyanobacterium]
METDGDLIGATAQLRKKEDIKAELDIELQLLRNQFSILKLERREAIAMMELHASSQAA